MVLKLGATLSIYMISASLLITNWVMEMVFTYRDGPRSSKTVTLYNDDRSVVGEVQNCKREGRWMWCCRICGAEALQAWKGCEHMAAAWRFIKQRRAEKEELWRRMDAMYPAEPAKPHVRFAPCPD